MTNKKTGTELSEEQVTDVVKKKNRGSDWMKELSADYPSEPGENARYIRNALASWDLPPIDISDPEQVKERIGMYFDYCSKNDRRPQVVGLCNWLGINRDTLNQWKNGEYRSDTHTDIIKRAYNIIEEMWMDNMQNGKTNPAAGIFLAKNWFQYKDVADVVVTPNNPYQASSDDELKGKYLTDIPTDDE